MVVSAPPTTHETGDQRLVLNGVPWSHYETQLALRGDRSVPRVYFLEGAMELMSPSQDHERIKFYIGRLVEAYALEKGIDFTGYGSWTLKHAPKEAGAEPDECYIIGADQKKSTPDLAIEVVWTASGLDKLEIYARLGVREVWFWKAGRIQIHELRAGRYETVRRSLCFPDLDVDLLVTFLDRPTASQAIRAFREVLRPSKAARRPRRQR